MKMDLNMKEKNYKVKEMGMENSSILWEEGNKL